MDLSSQSLSALATEAAKLPHCSLPDWREAAERLDAYLDRWKLADPLYQRLIGANLLALAMREWERQPERSPVELTLGLTQETVTEWLAGLPSESAADPLERAAAASLSLDRIGGLELWPRAFLSGEAPSELAERLYESAFQSGPALRISHMVSRPIDYGPFARLAREAWEQVGWREVGAILAFWVVIFAVACSVYFLFFSS